ncbi:Root cap [Musa troglodytarum]|uniref:Root cap n=1 Tax=Musa troglodytarum TaxID=320322 RepID=A0A9E7E884_9LILI|nr:Root cap [Musa troglodytarum]
MEAMPERVGPQLLSELACAALHEAMTSSTAPLLLALLLAFVARGHADLYGNPTPPAEPPSRVAGKIFPPDQFICNSPSSVCFGANITCPDQCPAFRPANPNEKACFIDCNNPTCEAVCGTRKPDCNLPGSGCKDPRFVGGDGIVFYFRGKANQHFTLVSDAGFQINARFIGLRPAGRRHDYTWIQSLGILFGKHTVTVSATPAVAWDRSADHLSFTFDGESFDLGIGHLSSWSSPAAGDLHVERTASVNSVIVVLPGSFEIRATVVPVTEEDDRIHKYNVPADDCFAHLDVQFKFFGLSERVEGVLGQTYQPNFQNPVKRGVPMPIMSGEDRYFTSSLLATDCKRCIFSPEVPVAPQVIDASAASFDCTSKMSRGYGIVCRR